MTSARVLPAALAAAAVAYAGWTWPERMFLGRTPSVGILEYCAEGEGLLHRAHPESVSVSHHMPGASILAAWIFTHRPPAGFGARRAAVAVLAALLALALALQLMPPVWAALAVLALAAFPRLWVEGTSYVHLLHSMYLLLIGGLVAWRARSPTVRRSLAVGLGVGCAVLFRSPLAFFPLVLALWELAARRLKGRGGLLHAAALCLPAAAALAPWVSLNRTLHRETIIFEHGEATPNIVTGALGMRHTWDGDWKAQELLRGAAGNEGSGSLVRWAAAESLRHPVRTVSAFLARLSYAVSQHPFLALGAALAVWRHRGRPEIRAVAGLAGYFVGLHCVMAVQEGYFRPVWPLGVGLIGAGAARQAAPPSRPATGLLLGALGLALAFAAATEVLVVRFEAAARRQDPASPEALDEALLASPGDSWLRFARGRRLLAQGRGAEARVDLELAARARGSIELRLWRDWARALAGDPGPLAGLKLPSISESTAMIEEFHILKAHGRWLARDRRGVRGELLHGLEARTLAPGAAESEQSRYLAAEFAAGLPASLKGRPAREIMALAAEAALLAPSLPSLSLEHAAQALAAGSRAEARRALTRAAAGALMDFERRRLAALWLEAGEYDRGLAVLRGGDLPAASRIARARAAIVAGQDAAAKGLLANLDRSALTEAEFVDLVGVYAELGDADALRAALARLAGRRPKGGAGIWILQARAAIRRGRPAAAKALLDIVRRESLDQDQRRELHRVFEEVGDKASAKAVLEDMAAGPSESAAWIRIRQAWAAAKRGDKRAAQELLARGLALSPRPADLHAAALARQQLGEHGAARALLDGLVRSHPREALYVKDRALSAYLEGDIGTAIRDLERAAQLDPGLLEAYVSLAAAHAGRGDFRAALTAAERGLAAKTRRAQPELRAKLEETRQDLRARLAATERAP